MVTIKAILKGALVWATVIIWCFSLVIEGNFLVTTILLLLAILLTSICVKYTTYEEWKQVSGYNLLSSFLDEEDD